MNPVHPFTRDDLYELDVNLLAHASEVVALEDIHDGNHRRGVIGLRHDVDGAHAFEEWCTERRRHYRAQAVIALVRVGEEALARANCRRDRGGRDHCDRGVADAGSPDRARGCTGSQCDSRSAGRECSARRETEGRESA